MILQQVNHNVRDERALLQGTQKLVTVVVSFVQAVLYVVSGMYAGSVTSLGSGNAVLAIIQVRCICLSINTYSNVCLINM
jgi:preprotein translocase subunit SecY